MCGLTRCLELPPARAKAEPAVSCFCGSEPERAAEARSLFAGVPFGDCVCGECYWFCWPLLLCATHGRIGILTLIVDTILTRDCCDGDCFVLVLRSVKFGFVDVSWRLGKCVGSVCCVRLVSHRDWLWVRILFLCQWILCVFVGV